MKIANMFYAAAALSLSVAAAPAMAVTVAHANIEDGSGYYGHETISKGNFSDVLTFTVPGSGLIDLNITFNAKSVTNLVAYINGEQITNFTAFGTTYTGQIEKAVAAGLQTLTVSGKALSSTSTYSGNVIYTSAVPEPASWALMVLGFGTAGVMMRRRRTAANTGNVVFA